MSTHSAARRTDSSADLLDIVGTAVFEIAGRLLIAVMVIAWWSLLFPMVSIPVALAIAAGVRSGWPAGTAVAFAGLLMLVVWRRWHPASFRAWLSERARIRFLTWFRYRRRWTRVLRACKLTVTDDDTEEVPLLRGVVIGEHLDQVRVQMLTGQAPSDYEGRVDRLAHAFKAQECRATVSGPSLITLTFRYDDPLESPIPWPGKHPNTLPRHLPTDGEDVA